MNIKKSVILKTTVFVLILVCLTCAFAGCFAVSYDWINDLSTRYMQTNFGVRVTHKKIDFFGSASSSKVVLGSAVLFLHSIEDGGEYYYLLTNNHTVAYNVDYDSIVYEVNDFKGNTYFATFVFGLAEYDLAVLKFKADPDNVYTPIRFASSNPAVNQNVVAVGQPNGQANSLTVGKVIAYNEINPDEDAINLSNVHFDVIYHNAPIDTGSSGGALIDERCVLVGINFAMTIITNDDKEEIFGCAIPIERVCEFLEKTGIIRFKKDV